MTRDPSCIYCEHCSPKRDFCMWFDLPLKDIEGRGGHCLAYTEEIPPALKDGIRGMADRLDGEDLVHVDFGPTHNTPESIAKGDLHGVISYPCEVNIPVDLKCSSCNERPGGLPDGKVYCDCGSFTIEEWDQKEAIPDQPMKVDPNLTKLTQEEDRQLTMIQKAQKTLEYLRSNAGKLTPKQSRTFACYVVEIQRDEALYRYRNRWFTLPVWPYMALKRFMIRRWYRRSILHLQSVSFQ